MKDRNVFIETFPIVWIYTLVVSILLWVIVSSMWAVSFLLGSVVSLMMMSLLYKTNEKVLKAPDEQAEKVEMRKYVLKYVLYYALRYAFYAIVLIVAIQSDKLEFFGVAAGLFSFKVCLYFNMMVLHRNDRNG